MQQLDIDFAEFNSTRRFSGGSSDSKEIMYKIYTNLLQAYIESSFKLKDLANASEVISKMNTLYPKNSNCMYF